MYVVHAYVLCVSSVLVCLVWFVIFICSVVAPRPGSGGRRTRCTAGPRRGSGLSLQRRNKTTIA